MRRNTEHLHIRVEPRRLHLWRAAAVQAEVTFSEFVRAALDAYTRERLADDRAPAGR
jgi:hypothetical protein